MAKDIIIPVEVGNHLQKPFLCGIRPYNKIGTPA